MTPSRFAAALLAVTGAADAAAQVTATEDWQILAATAGGDVRYNAATVHEAEGRIVVTLRRDLPDDAALLERIGIDCAAGDYVVQARTARDGAGNARDAAAGGGEPQPFDDIVARAARKVCP